MKNSQSKKSRFGWLALPLGAAMALSALLLVLPLLGSVPSAIPAVYFSVPDSEGANNGPGQKDLTQMGWFEDKGNLNDPNDDVLDMFWSWDEITVSGNNTLDACALFDKDSTGPGYIDAAICGTIQRVNPGGKMLLKGLTVYKCSDSKNDRCTNPALQTNPSAGDLQGGALDVVNGVLSGPPLPNSDLITHTDPFCSPVALGAGCPDDTTLRVRAKRSYLNSLVAGGMARLTNVCSYPSQQPNSDPSDCNNPPGGGFLKIVKVVDPSPNTQVFNFNVISSPTTLPGGTYPCPSPNGCNDTAAEGDPASLSLLIGLADVEEKNIATGWSLNNATCYYDDDPNKVDLGGTFSTPKYTGAPISSGQITVCEFTNKRDRGRITVTKVVDTNDKFTLLIKKNGSTVKSANNIGNQGSLGPEDLDVGTYVASEESYNGTVMSYYTSSWVCLRNGGSWKSGSGTTTEDLPIAKDDVIACTFTNSQKMGSLKVIKKVDNSSTPNGKVASDFKFKIDGVEYAFEDDGGDPLESAKEVNVTPFASHNVTEDAPPNYTASFSTNCTNVQINPGDQKICTITNTADKASPGGTTVQRWVLHDKIIINGSNILAKKDDNTTDPSVTFRLYSAAGCAVGSLVGTEANRPISLVNSEFVSLTETGFAVSSPGTYYWRVEYSGNKYNNGFTTDCGLEITTITVPTP